MDKKKIITGVLLMFALAVFTACGSSDSDKISFQEGTYANPSNKAAQAEQTEERQEENETPSQEEDAIFMVIENDIQNYQITLQNLTDTRQICYEYTDGTEFFDKYGNYTLSKNFTTGSLAVIQRLNSNDTLGALAFTDRTWDYEKVRNYSIDTDRKIISIANTSYRYDAKLKVFSEGSEINLYDIGEEDVLTVYGVDKTIYSIILESGHGTLALTNTELFEGGWLNLGTKVYVVITKDMQIEVPEGVYEFSVANDGYGDSGEIRIRRNKTTTIDLNDYKGEGPKMCKVTFNVGVENAIVMINGEEINYKKPLELKYGVYRLGVIAEGYDPWSKQLVIKAPTATIDIALSETTPEEAGKEDSDEKEDDSGSKSNKSNKSSSSNSSQNTTSSNTGKAGSMAGSYSNKNKTPSSGSSSSKADSLLAGAALDSSIANIITGGNSTDYLDTLADLIDSLSKLQGDDDD